MSPARPGHDHVLISGLGKTGTSGVYTSIKTGLHEAGHEARTLFEPTSSAMFYEHFHHAPNTPMVAKIILQELRKMDLSPKAFERRVMTVRDPRDTAISGLLFRPLITAVLKRVDDKAIGRFVDALRAKEQDPASVSVVDLYELSTELDMGARPSVLMVAILEQQLNVITNEQFHIVRYEDFVEGRLDELSDYLGYPVRNISTSSSGLYGHTSRSESSGSFRDWFLPSDVEYFNSRWGQFLERAGYPLDVELSAAPKIDPATSSDYVLSRVESRRKMLESGARHADLDAGRDRDWAVAYAELSERGLDGDAVACVRAARLAMGDRLGAPDPEQALKWARLAAQQGSVQGMQLMMKLLAHAQDPVDVRERLGWQRQVNSRRNSADAGLAVELDELRGSASYRLGNALVRAARSPRQDGPAAVRELAGMVRARRDQRRKS